MISINRSALDTDTYDMAINTLLLIGENSNKLETLKHFLNELKYTVITVLENDVDLTRALTSIEYCVVVFSIHEFTQWHIGFLQHIQQSIPKPVIVFADRCDEQWIMKAVNVGANSIVVDGIKESRIKSIIDIATARFQRCIILRSELRSTKQKLEERRDIDRAKGILMRKKNVDEEQAYQLFRKIAMDKNKRIGEVSATLIMATELLD